MQVVHNQILKHLLRIRKGKIIFPGDFAEFGTINAINQSLSRLAKHGKLIRLGQGIYYLPKVDPELGVILPSIEQIATAIARRDKIILIPTGSYALHRLGISTQVPTQSVFLTNGSPRTIKIGNRTIKLKKTTPKRLLVKGKNTQLIMQALSELGPKAVDDHVRAKLAQALRSEDPQQVKKDAPLAPAWISKIILQCLNTNHGEVDKLK
jgi:Family of unknown function (DUF6088)